MSELHSWLSTQHHGLQTDLQIPKAKVDKASQR